MSIKVGSPQTPTARRIPKAGWDERYFMWMPAPAGEESPSPIERVRMREGRVIRSLDPTHIVH